MNLPTFKSRCYEIYVRGTLRNFRRNPLRQRYFDAWKRAIAVEHGLFLRSTVQERNWQIYLTREWAIREARAVVLAASPALQRGDVYVRSIS